MVRVKRVWYQLNHSGHKGEAKKMSVPNLQESYCPVPVYFKRQESQEKTRDKKKKTWEKKSWKKKP